MEELAVSWPIAGLVRDDGAAGMAAESQATTTNPDQKQLTQAVKAFLADHGDLCMAKYSWPRDVIPGDEKTDPNDAIQLPVLERLGVVRSVEIPNPQTSTAATDEGFTASSTYRVTTRGVTRFVPTAVDSAESVATSAETSFSRMSLQRSTHSSQMKTVGPAISLRT